MLNFISLVALNSGGYTHPWASAYVLCQLVIGIALISAFVIWEWKFVKTAMVPAALFEGQRVVALAYVVVFVAGMNFYAFLNLFPTTLSSVYTPSPVEIGIRSFGFALGVGLGVPLGDAALSFVKGQVKIVLLVSATLMSKFHILLSPISSCEMLNSISYVPWGTCCFQSNKLSPDNHPCFIRWLRLRRHLDTGWHSSHDCCSRSISCNNCGTLSFNTSRWWFSRLRHILEHLQQQAGI